MFKYDKHTRILILKDGVHGCPLNYFKYCVEDIML